MKVSMTLKVKDMIKYRLRIHGHKSNINIKILATTTIKFINVKTMKWKIHSAELSFGFFFGKRERGTFFHKPNANRVELEKLRTKINLLPIYLV